ncbi:bifunctional phosphoribosyl-AMP cyclohydrolase/phosphoribosyl-ATP diphosphatase HisIE [Fodinibius salsisoli]|uniref:Histidine biosynthesis bifunctional protein HisIE n=1 Tax=Fodinibius salsisoli TaxID=2820877 RepID=A0ABT3PQ89_9BACT|nr:bifunctional phosphoribosyl-AMP cyclohydrolase/phosphoribosyl-ATP diphosphatase HisIE [Fodinibius salsisoli]MCW9708032.1 bifunctional phosphoribosyl-AMP cyclohydrolase/phosphoribosyl-ATP diphosphatase HisIE [Fodinibius salsisoli]
MIDIDSLDFSKGDGLIPAIIQDADNFQVLMLGYMNKEAVEMTLSKGRVTFYSRSKQRLWTKGETSENYLELVDLQQDCDDDTLLVLAHPQGPTCHTGHQSCFFQKDFTPKDNLRFLAKLETLIQSRKQELPEGSYTTSLFQDGIDEIAQKVGEEAVETIIEAKNDNPDDFKDEVSDLLYHLLVLLTEKELPLAQIIERLEERHK